MAGDTLILVREVAAKQVLYSVHAIQQMAHSDRLITRAEVCAPKPDYLAIITAYLPDPNQWADDFRRRR